MKISRINLVLVSGGLISVVAFAVAGPLSPPAGPISSTYKTLTEVEPRIAITSLPFLILQPGSYYLTGNLTGVSGQTGILVSSDNVTIDLNGFMLNGNNHNATRAIQCDGRYNVTICNGRIFNWQQDGIYGYLSHQTRVENVTVDSSMAGFGILVGYGSVITDCQVHACTYGLVVADGGTVSNCTADSNVLGIELGAGSVATGCTAVANSANGMYVRAAGNLHACVSRGNGQNGFQIEASSTLVNCTSTSNAGKGFLMDGAGQLLACTSSTNAGIGVDIAVPNGTAICAVVDGCAINFNGSHGLNQSVGGGSTFSNNTIARNGGAGMVILDGDRVINNRILDNGPGGSAAGIQVNGSVNTIQGNNILNNGVMYSFASGTNGNLFFANTCRGGAQFNSGSNTIAPFVAASTAFSGSSLGTSNGFVNITY